MEAAQVPGHSVPRPSPWAALLVTLGIGALTFAIVKANDWGWHSFGIFGSLALSAVCLALFVRTACAPVTRSSTRRCFASVLTGAALVMAPYSIAFGAMLFSVAVWEQDAWGWSALKTGLAIAARPCWSPSPHFCWPGRLIARFGTRP